MRAFVKNSGSARTHGLGRETRPSYGMGFSGVRPVNVYGTGT
jgi:hypothetical protein